MDKKYIKNNVTLQGIISDTLFNEHCICSLIVLLDSGREIQLEYNKKFFWISQTPNKIVISTENNEGYSNAYELIIQARVEGKYLLDIWDEVEVSVLL
jgi:hypothetical protein